ncbi:MAG: hypothetical protein HWN65_13665 [Candidatus Helarchaeota archaeon]|nr:hypothetical protein [Candidatus Helarchaeota archaeon]
MLEKLPNDTTLFVLSDDSKVFSELYSNTRLKLVPIYSVLRNNSEFSENVEISQIDQSGNSVSSLLCPNNPKLEPIIKADFETLAESSQIAGIQMTNLEMPLNLSNLGCFCPYCLALAEKRSIDLQAISIQFTKKSNNGLSLRWIQKEFPDWLKFRMDSVSNLAGRLMIAIRKYNPDIFLGLNVNFSEIPAFFGQDYFFLALFLDNLNFIVNGNSHLEEKRFLKQIRSVTKGFLGDIKLFLQMKVPYEYNLNKISKFITRLKKFSFDGLIFQVSTINELNPVIMM